MNSDTIDTEMQQRIQELQYLEQNLQQLLMQKQAFQLELNETLNALEEVTKADDEIYKVVGSIMIKAEKKNTIKELEDKKKILELRNDALGKQEKLIEAKAKELREETQKSIKDKNKS